MAQARSTWLVRLGAFLVGVALVGGGLGPAGRADDKTADPPKPKADDKKAKTPEPTEAALRDEVLKFNTITNEQERGRALLKFVRNKDRAKKAVAVAAKMMAAADDKPFKYEASMLLGQAATYLKEYAAAKVFLEHAVASATKIDSAEKMATAYEALIDSYWSAKKYQPIIDLVEKIVELRGPDEFDAYKVFFLERLVQAKVKLGDADDALRIVAGLIQADEGSAWYFLRLKGWILYETRKLDAAIETYLEALDKLDANKRLAGERKDREKDRIRYILSSLYVDNKDVDKAAKQLQTLITRNPENPTYKNDLGFIWADNDMNLEKAEGLIREALDLDRKAQEQAKEEGRIDEVRENAAYLDSMGWVLFKQKKFKEALPYLVRASKDEDDGQHLEIWDHLADTYMALGEKQKAIDTWQAALQMEDVSPRDADRRKKVAAKLTALGVEPKLPPKKKVYD